MVEDSRIYEGIHNESGNLTKRAAEKLQRNVTGLPFDKKTCKAHEQHKREVSHRRQEPILEAHINPDRIKTYSSIKQASRMNERFARLAWVIEKGGDLIKYLEPIEDKKQDSAARIQWC